MTGPSRFAVILSAVVLCGALSGIARGEASGATAQMIADIEAAETLSGAKRAYVTALEAGDVLEVHQAFLAKAVTFGKAAPALTAAQRVAKTDPDDALAQSVIACAFAQRRSYITATEAAVKAASLTPGDPISLYNVGQLMGWLSHNPEQQARLSDEAKQGIGAGGSSWANDANYNAGFQRVRGGYLAYDKALEAKEAEVATVTKQIQNKATHYDNLKTELNSSRARENQYAAAGDPNNPANNPYLAYIDHEKKLQAKIRKQMAQVGKQGGQLAKKRKALQKELKKFPGRKDEIIRSADKHVALMLLGQELTIEQPKPEQPKPTTQADDGKTPAKPAGPDKRAEVVVDSDNQKLVAGTGEWFFVDQFKDKAIGGMLLTDNNTNKDAGNQIVFNVNLPQAGQYEVFFHNIGFPQCSAKTPIDVVHTQGKATQIINQREGGTGWISLGKYQFGTAGAQVIVRNAGTDGHVFADAVKFVPAD